MGTSGEPSNGALLEKILNIHESMNRIEQQTVKTNGRVGKLESWRDKIIGALLLTNILLIPLLISTVMDK